jgi:primosomal protein N' (replication factor Y)
MPPEYVNIVFNLPVDSGFTYLIPKDLSGDIALGSRVLAPFGKRNITGIVTGFPGKTDLKKLKSITGLLDTEPIIYPEMLSFCKWISGYYICPIGEVVFSAVPKGILVESKILYSLDLDAKATELSPLQQSIVDLLSSTAPNGLTIKQIEKRLNAPGVRSAAAALAARRLLLKEHVTLSGKTKTKLEKFVVFELKEEFKDYTRENLEIFFKENNFNNKCQVKLMTYLVTGGIDSISAKELLRKTGATPFSLNALAKKEFIRLEKKPVSREDEHSFSPDSKIVGLNTEQRQILKEINSSVDCNEFTTFLLFGITGSGKTQVYIEAIQNAINLGKTAIVLVPEISLTPQLINRFKTYFGNIIGVIHSKLSDGQRFDVHQRIKNGEIKIVIGARSALFAPLVNIGIIIVDEEHDHSYKQTEKNPKYNARDCAIVRAKLNNAAVVLGSATPSMESYYNYKAGKYKLLELPHRALKTKPPIVEIVNMLDEIKQSSKYKKYETPEQRVLSSKLISYIDSALNQRQNVILMQNRRGYSAYQQCLECGTVKMCRNCDITMIYHKHQNNLRCHYCGYTENLLTRCEICTSSNLKLVGVGTEKIEEEIARLFPKAKIKRMDSDTVKGKDAHRKILNSFHAGEFDILIGTQMISKGLDFPNVYLVGVISADIGLFIPDFRSSEKTFQLLMQVSGRSGRISDYGKVVIQTMNPDNYIFPLVENHSYTDFFEKEIRHRATHKYPPFSKMILIENTASSQVNVNSIAWKLYHFLDKKIRMAGDNHAIEIMKPAPALIYKIKNSYRMHIIIKIMKSTNDTVALSENMIRELYKHVKELKLKTSERVSVDVDPLSFY